MFAVEECRLEGIFVTKMSSMSGFLREQDGQLVGPRGASTLRFFALT